MTLREALRLYLVADPEHSRGDFFTTIESALRGGVNAVQLRAKNMSDRKLYQHAVMLKELCSKHGAVFLVNDRLDIALAVDADGVHLGVDDLPIPQARELCGTEFIIGYSPEGDSHITSARSQGADYLGIGPVFGTGTKADAGVALGLSEFQRRLQLGGLPTVGIGGITTMNSTSVLDAGADGVAVVSAILGAEEPEAAANQLSRNS